MTEAVLEKTSEQLADSARKISRATAAFVDAMDESIETMKHAAKRGGDAMEEFMDDNTLRVKRHPVETVVTAFAGGFLLGGFISWLARRK